MKLPTCEEEERYVLGSMMMDYDIAVDILAVASPDDFFHPFNQSLARICWEKVSQGRLPTLVDLNQCVRGMDDLNAITQLQNDIFSPAPAPEYAKKIAETAFCRRAIKELIEVVRVAQEGKAEATTDLACKMIDSLINGRKTEGSRHIKDFLQVAYEQIEKAGQTDGPSGVQTGFKALDTLFGGWQLADLVFIAGRPGMGKTAFLLQLAQGAAKAGTPVEIYSLEMSGEQLAKRAMSSEGLVNGVKVRSGKLQDEEWTKIARAMGILSDLPIYIDDTGGLSIEEIHIRAKRSQRQKGTGLIVVDYAQLIKCNGAEGRADEVSKVCRGLKNIGKDLKVPVLAAAQVKREVETRPDKRPGMSDFKESGGIEENADAAMMLYRDDYYNPETEKKGIAEIIVAKNRNGPTPTIELCWLEQFTKFVELDRRHSA